MEALCCKTLPGVETDLLLPCFSSTGLSFLSLVSTLSLSSFLSLSLILETDLLLHHGSVSFVFVIDFVFVIVSLVGNRFAVALLLQSVSALSLLLGTSFHLKFKAKTNHGAKLSKPIFKMLPPCLGLISFSFNFNNTLV